jgi:hypothetical protein
MELHCTRTYVSAAARLVLLLLLYIGFHMHLVILDVCIWSKGRPLLSIFSLPNGDVGEMTLYSRTDRKAPWGEEDISRIYTVNLELRAPTSIMH